MAEKENDKDKKPDKAEPEKEGAADGEGKKSKKKLFILIALVLVVLGGGAAAFFLLKGKKPAADAAASADGHGAPAEAAHAEAGHAADGAKPEEHAATGKEGEAKAGGDHKTDDHATETKTEKKGDGHGDDKKNADAHGDSANKDGSTEAKKEGETATAGFGETYNFKPFHLNLGNPLDNRYVRIEIAAEYRGGEDHKKELESRLPQLRDAVISIVQGKTREFILSPTGKDRLRYEITTQLNQLLTKKIENVYITDLIIE